MNPSDKRLLLRVAQRMEREAKAAYDTAGRTESAKSTRDNVMGDVLDLRDYVARREEDEKAVDSILTGAAVLVPKEPTDGMTAAGATALTEGEPGDLPRAAVRAWAAMVAASRQPS